VLFVRVLIASTVTVTGLNFAQGWSQPGIDSTGANAEDAKVNGKIHTKLAACTDSTSLMDSPMNAESHENA